MSNSLRLRIMEIAKAKGISIRKLERDLGYANRTISKLEFSSPSIDKVQKIANYLDVSIDVLVGNEVPQYDLADLDDLRYLHDNPDLRILLTAAKDLPKDSINAIAEIARRMNSNDL